MLGEYGLQIYEFDLPVFILLISIFIAIFIHNNKFEIKCDEHKWIVENKKILVVGNHVCEQPVGGGK